MNEKDKYTKEDAYQTLSIINEWTRSSDTKTSILMAFISILLGFTLAVFDGITYLTNLEKINLIGILVILLLVVYILSAAAAILFSCLSLIARLKTKHKNDDSLFFFGDIARLSQEDYENSISNLDDKKIITDLKTQILINSKIAKRKLRLFNLGLMSSIALFVSAMALLIIIHCVL